MYILAVEARAGGQARISVHTFPARLDSLGYRLLLEDHAGDPGLIEFWQSLKDGYAYFESAEGLPKISIARGNAI